MIADRCSSLKFDGDARGGAEIGSWNRLETALVKESKTGHLVLVFELPCTKRYFRYCRLTSFQEIVSDGPRTILIPWRAREEPLASASA